ncbi:ferrous iron transport protein A [Desulfovibrio sp. OttesenSCG-928-F20]|nr:ferrous iron transport protein A [Desulfovibrio sp. OttesenSCG-928-F20]
MPPGCPLLVTDLKGSPALRSRLYAMGILPGTELELCQGCDRGSVCVRVRQCSLVLGESLANAIYCCPALRQGHLRRHGHHGFHGPHGHHAHRGHHVRHDGCGACPEPPETNDATSIKECNGPKR